MDRRYYDLSRKLFEMRPDSFFYYPTQFHSRALVTLHYGVQRRKRFVVVTGEVGTGKTLLLRCVLDALSHNKIAFAFVYNPVLSVADFLAHVLTEFGLPFGAPSKAGMLAKLNSYLVAGFSRGEGILGN